jgi:D-alanyl-D-alanine carboxypeptidase/D-alanyl-D-alanine-endopeptidase (penicillin-binding protein 4)
LLKPLGARFGKKGSFAEGILAVARFLQDSGIDTGGFVMVDGSGMSRINLVSPEQILGLLRVMAHHPQFQSFHDSLPIAGRDGTLKNRMQGTLAENNVRAKTGHVRFVSCLSGYVTAAHGERLAFSMMANNLPDGTSGADALQDRICARLAEFTRP